MIAYDSLKYPLPYIPAEKRTFLPRHNVCSIAPAEDSSDNFITGNGALRLQASGCPYHEAMTFSHEELYAPRWLKTPEPPDLRPVLPEIRRLLREDRNEEVDAILDKAQKDAGFAQYGMKWEDENGKPLLSVMPVGGPRKMTPYWITYDQPEQDNTRNYLRWLNMENGLIVSQWTNDSGDYKTESFCAYDGDVTVNRLTGPKGKLNVEVTVEIPGEKVISFGGRRFSQNYDDCTKEKKLTEETYVLTWGYDPKYGKKSFIDVIRYIPVGGKGADRLKGYILAAFLHIQLPHKGRQFLLGLSYFDFGDQPCHHAVIDLRGTDHFFLFIRIFSDPNLIDHRRAVDIPDPAGFFLQRKQKAARPVLIHRQCLHSVHFRQQYFRRVVGIIVEHRIDLRLLRAKKIIQDQAYCSIRADKQRAQSLPAVKRKPGQIFHDRPVGNQQQIRSLLSHLLRYALDPCFIHDDTSSVILFFLYALNTVSAIPDTGSGTVQPCCCTVCRLLKEKHRIKPRVLNGHIQLFPF